MAEGPSIEGVGLLGIRDLLGASEELSVQQLAVYLPDKDRNGNAFDNQVWIDEALRSFSKVGGGASAIRDLAGAWLNPETGELQRIPVKLPRSRRGGSSCGILHEKVSVRKLQRVGIE